MTGTAPNVDEARSKGIADADIKDTGGAGTYCANLPAYKTISAMQDEPFTGLTALVDVFVIEDDAGICNGAGFGPANTLIITADADSGASARANFDLQLWN